MADNSIMFHKREEFKRWFCRGALLYKDKRGAASQKAAPPDLTGTGGYTTRQGILSFIKPASPAAAASRRSNPSGVLIPS